MNHITGLRSSQEDRSSASPTPAPATPAAGGNTVLNPEGRSTPVDGSTSSSFPLPTEDLPADRQDLSTWRRLFPVDDDPSGQTEPDTAAGCELGHFLIEERIGSGGMGAVFRALDTRLQRVIALKVLSPVQSRDRAAVLRFQNEARAAARLDHENIARVFYIGEDRGLHFIAFEYVMGQNVRDAIIRAHRLRVADAVNYVLQIASALRHTSAAGVVHRDIKPSNIIIAPNGRAKLVDLGLARKLAADSLGDLTVVGTTLGTFDYISPEQARDPRNVDVRSDIYSLGCTLYHMLTGGPPYSSGTVLQKLLDHQQGMAPDPRLSNPAVPPALSAICRKMMAGDPRHRYATPDDLIRDLASVAAGIGLRPTLADSYVWSRPPALPATRLRPGFVWAGSVAIVLALAFLVDTWPTSREPRTSTNTPAIVHPNGQPVPSMSPDISGGVATANSMDEEMGANSPSSEITAPGPAQPTESPGMAVVDSTPENTLPPPQSVPSDPLTGSGPVPGISEGMPGTIAPTTAQQPMPADPNGDSIASTGNGAALMADFTPGDTPLVEPSPEGERAMQELRTSVEVLTGIFKPILPFVDSEAPPAEPAPLAGNTSNPPTNVMIPLEESVEEPILIASPFALVSATDPLAPARDFGSLAEAIARAETGDTIELRYNGKLPSGPITNSITIGDRKIALKAGRDASNRRYHPIIEFQADAAGDDVARMIHLDGDDAELEIHQIELQHKIDGAALDAEPGALFVIQGAGKVSLREVAISIDSKRTSCSVFDLRPPPETDRRKTSLQGRMGEQGRFEIEVFDSFVRGTADLVTIGYNHQGRIQLEHSGFVLQQSLLNVTGDDEPLSPLSSKDVISVDLNHVTAVLANPLLRVDLSGNARHVAPMKITATNNVIATTEKGPLIFMYGVPGGASFADVLTWRPERNILDGFSEYWSARRPADGSMFEFPSTFTAWEQYWERHNTDWLDREPEIAIDSINDRIQLWRNPEAIAQDPITVRPGDLELRDDATAFEIHSTDFGLAGVNVGANPAELPPLMDGAADSVAADARSANR